MADDSLLDTDTQPEVTDFEPVDDEAGTDIAVRTDDKWVDPDKDWAHEWIEFEGDRLAVRKPTTQALAAYSLSASQFVAPQIQNDISGLFMARHMAQGSYLHVMDRFINGDDPDYDEKTVGALMRMIVELTTGPPEADNRAARRAAGKAG